MAINPVRLALAVAALMLNLSVIQQTKADSFLTNSPLATARAEHTATLLPIGKVLVADGYGETNCQLSSAELFDPVTGKWTATGALGFEIPASYAEEQIERTRTMGAYKASTLIDFERHQPLELEGMFLEPLRRAQAAGVPVPRLAALCAVLQQLDQTR